MNPKYPIYIISKGRWESRLTSKTLERMNVPYRIVIEPQEYVEYSKVIDPAKILVLPFSNLGQGSIPARNWVWKHSIAEGGERHWVLDDNIEQFNRLTQNLQVKVADGTIFKCAEDFVDRYENIALAGFQYDHFAKAKTVLPAFSRNTRIYSCTLIKNDLEYRWRGKYNEDTDLSLRMLKDGHPTVLFNAFIQQKATTMKMKGGNTEMYNVDTDKRKEFAESLQTQHPDVVKVVWRYERWHHQVDYTGYKGNKMIKKAGVNPPDVVNNYGMKLTTIEKKGKKKVYVNPDDSNGSSQMGTEAEEAFKALWELKFPECTVDKSSVWRDMREHWDYRVTWPDGTSKRVDVKSRKHIDRNDDNVQDDEIWVEFLNNQGNTGWVYGDADFIAQEYEKGFIIVKREALALKCEEILGKTRKEIVNSIPRRYKALHHLYQRPTKYDMITTITMDELLSINHRKIK